MIYFVYFLDFIFEKGIVNFEIIIYYIKGVLIELLVLGNDFGVEFFCLKMKEVILIGF